MIVNYLDGKWQIVAQRTHGLLAGQLCFQWAKVKGIEPWFETIVATAEHDDVYNEFENDAHLLNTNGGPVNYKMRPFEKAKCEALLENAKTRSQYIAILTSRHIRFLYEDFKDKAVKEYIADLKRTETKWISESRFSEQQIALAYTLLQWCDALSLLICQNILPPDQRKIEISTGPGGQTYYLYAIDEATLVVDPWPFEKEAFDISFEFRTLSQLSFGSVDEFRQLLDQTSPSVQSYRIVSEKQD